MIKELPLILVYISAFGISDLIIKNLKLCDRTKLIYYVLLLFISFVIYN